MGSSHPTVALTFAVVLAACGDSSGSAASDCPTTGSGSLAVNVSGLPGGVPAAVTVTGPGGTRTATATQTLTGLAAGEYEVTAATVAQADLLVRTAFAAAPASSRTCVRDAQTGAASVSYAAVPSSHKLWVGDGSSSLGFAPTLLGATGTVGPTVDADTGGSRGIAFDRQGNAWVIGATTADPPLARYPASSLGTGGAKTPDRTIAIAGVSCIPGLEALAFDAAGQLWVSVKCADKVVRLTPAQLASSGTATPAVEITGLTDPEGIAFDAAGNLWVAGFGANALYRFTPANQALTGAQTLTPTPRVSVSVSALLEGMAFDESGGLWLAYSGGKFARFGPTQLTASTTPGAPTVPERIITGTGLAYAGDVALYPAPAATPLYGRLP